MATEVCYMHVLRLSSWVVKGIPTLYQAGILPWRPTSAENQAKYTTFPHVYPVQLQLSSSPHARNV